MSKTFTRKHKEDKPVLAICYDFDKTLSPDDMQAQGYIQSVYSEGVESFWKESNSLAEDNDMDTNLAYMFKMVKMAHGKFFVTRQKLEDYGSKVELFPGVSEWFERIRQYGVEKGVIVEHYIISSGLKEMIEGTSVARAGAFKKIYASSFLYDDDGVAVWPAQTVNYTSKTQFLFRIKKGVLDVNDTGVNDFFAPEDVRVPFRNIVYIGDSDTDIPCMKLVNLYGGHSIGVYNNSTLDKTKVYKMMRDNRIKFFTPTDYNEGSEIDILIKAIIDRTAANETLENIHFDCKKERKEADVATINNDRKRKKTSLILSLSESRSFATTHTVISELREIDSWDDDEIDMLLDIAMSNSQVCWLLNDCDVKLFYKSIIKQSKTHNPKINAIEEIFDKS